MENYFSVIRTSHRARIMQLVDALAIIIITRDVIVLLVIYHTQCLILRRENVLNIKMGKRKKDGGDEKKSLPFSQLYIVCAPSRKNNASKMLHALSTMHNRIGLIRTRNKRERKPCKRDVREEYTDDSVRKKTQI